MPSPRVIFVAIKTPQSINRDFIVHEKKTIYAYGWHTRSLKITVPQRY
jgi:hypothetical protein